MRLQQRSRRTYRRIRARREEMHFASLPIRNARRTRFAADAAAKEIAPQATNMREAVQCGQLRGFYRSISALYRVHLGHAPPAGSFSQRWKGGAQHALTGSGNTTR